MAQHVVNMYQQTHTHSACVYTYACGWVGACVRVPHRQARCACSCSRVCVCEARVTLMQLRSSVSISDEPVANTMPGQSSNLIFLSNWTNWRNRRTHTHTHTHTHGTHAPTNERCEH
jgi:hypothetical protein